MSFGDHLEDLRSHVLRSVISVGVGILIGLAVAAPLLEIICQPVVTLLRASHLDPQLQVLNPQESFLTWMKVALFSGLVLAAPYVIWEIWRFVAAGLYAHEQRIVRQMVTPSVLLFLLGVLFFFFIVLPLALNFFISFAGRLTVGELTPGRYMQWVIGEEESAAEAVEPLSPVNIPVLAHSPPNPAPGDMWVDRGTRELRVADEGRTYSVPLTLLGEHQIVQSQFRLQEYITFVGMLALSFGLAFQLPVVVVFLAWTGIFSTKQMAGARKYVLFGIVVAASLLTPTPDALNLTLLVVPMILLFEGGLIVGRMLERRRGDEPA